MKVLVSGASGLVGRTLVPALQKLGHNVSRLVRRAPMNTEEIFWDPEAGILKADHLSGFDAVVHLSGESIAGGRWTKAKKERIYTSRINGTKLLIDGLGRVPEPPAVFLGASAIGYYGSRGMERLNEDSGLGGGFLSLICRDWEAQSKPLARSRVVHMRFGMILSPQGGALQKMLLPFKLGLGGVIGSGDQYMSWIALDDVVGAIAYLLTANSLREPVNVVAPQPVTNREFTAVLGKVLSRPTFLPMPAFAAKLAFGEMADELLLASQRVEPVRLAKAGFQFRYPQLEGALRHLLS